MALDIFRTPRKGRLREQDLQFLEGALRDTIHAEKLAIRTYSWSGKGACILLAHGWESNSARWRTFINLFRKAGYQVVALDAPAHGETSSDRFDAHWYGLALQAVADTLQPSFIVGHSAGGMALAYFLSKNSPSYLKGAVVVAAPSGLRKVLSNFNKVMGLNNRAIKGMEAAVKTCFTLAVDDFSLFDFGKKIETPGLLLFDTDDPIADYDEGQRLETLWKNSRFKGYSGLGHSMNNKIVAEEMLRFFQKLSQ